MRGYASKPGRRVDARMRRPQRMQRRSSSSFQAWQWTHCILSQFFEAVLPAAATMGFLTVPLEY